jgi:LysM repeat protein
MAASIQTSRPRSTGRDLFGVSKRPLVAATALVGFLVVAATPAAAHESHVVEPGDSLSVIARDHGITTEELAAANGIADHHLIKVGQVLTIPGVTPTFYEVKPGDSLSVIAKQAGVSLDDLARINGISDVHLIRVGQVLEMPTGSAVISDPAAGYERLPSRLRENPERLQLIPSFERWADHYGIDADLLMAMAYRESGWQTDVISHKGAVGVGQLMPTTSDWIAGSLIGAELDPYQPDDNIRMSARLIQWLIGYLGSESAAVAAYYQGQGSIAANGLYDDTIAYVDNVAQIRSMFVKN